MINEQSIMVELWEECNNFCEFCFIDSFNKKTNDDIKLNNIQLAKDILNKINEPKKAFGLIGGEFFQGQLNTSFIKDSFYDLCKLIFDKMNNELIEDFWCCCTLTIGNQQDLYHLIDLFNKTIKNKEKHKFWILTSYDTKGRYTSKQKFDNWNNHMLNLQQYPFIKFNVTSILSQDFCEKVIKNKLNLNEFRQKYQCKLFFKQPTQTRCGKKEELNKKISWFFVKRKTFLEFLQKIKKDYTELFDEILNIDLRADTVYSEIRGIKEIDPHIRNKETWDETDSDYNAKCGHIINYQCYSDSDACCLCDYLKIKNNGE